MIRIIMIIIICSCSLNQVQTTSIFATIKQRNYSFSFQRQKEKAGTITNLFGNVYRNKDTCYLKQEELVNIQTDSIFVSIDTILRMAFAGVSTEMKANLGPLSLDPYNIIMSAKEFSSGNEKNEIDNKIVCHYFFDSTYPIKSLSYTYWKRNDSLDYFKVSLVYTQRLGTVNETILYRRSEDIKISKKPFTESDYILKKGSRLFLNNRLSNYIFSNYIK